MYVTYDLQVMGAYNTHKKLLKERRGENSRRRRMMILNEKNKKTQKTNIKLLSSEDVAIYEIGVINPFSYILFLHQNSYLTRDGMEQAIEELNRKASDAFDMDSLEFMLLLCDVIEMYRSKRIPHELDLRYNLKIMIGVGKYFLRVLKFRG